MPGFLLYANTDPLRNSSQLNAVLVNGASAGAAATAAQAAAPNGEVRGIASWTALQLQAGDFTLPGSVPIWIQGEAATLTRFRGG